MRSPVPVPRNALGWAGVLLAVALAAGCSAGSDGRPAESVPATDGVDLSLMDPSVRPGDDFYRYANGGWL
ncbi:MAG TPA: hypothetical protein VIS76_00450, partial [Pseudomonadales bacterium]